jgi:Arc/MetJ-type ribon-helix-helix transcriptional regulator
MVDGMATKKVTITLDAGQLDRIHTLVGSGAATSVSGFVQHAVGAALDDVAGWGAMLADALEATGGELFRRGAPLGGRGARQQRASQVRCGLMAGITTITTNCAHGASTTSSWIGSACCLLSWTDPRLMVARK